MSNKKDIRLLSLNELLSFCKENKLPAYTAKQIYESFVEIEALLLRVGYLLKHNSRVKISKFKKFISRAKTSSDEINVLRGIVHQINWFLNNSKRN